ncbi:MAG: DISARM system phospholipase D-like protein DrmC [Propionibacteriaceae bacterium]|jgi:phosphatidylserine/phosphatidylglycerophosphate/cardiolipin synthase-like enzyme|nr:DISARM system phospholipase D-like protein DrmC [Propionibacteriaceae bacterium]
MPDNPFTALGAYLTSTEAEALAVLLENGQHISLAVNSVNQSRREKAKKLLADAGISHTEPRFAGAVLRSVVGAKSVLHDLVPVWTMPGNEADTGHLTGEFSRLVHNARISITCATYNFETTSQMWDALKQAAERLDIAVTVYLDASASASAAVKTRLAKATVYRSSNIAGKLIRSHAKFVIIDHTLVLLTSANFSWSAENRNIEFGLLVHDATLATSVESTMVSKHGTLYEIV